MMLQMNTGSLLEVLKRLQKPLLKVTVQNVRQ